MVTRGIRNNNPANIRRGSSWKGLVSTQLDRDFCQFASMEYGIRAFFVLMRTYYYKHHITTVEGILYRFAPSSENDTFSYISFVQHYMNEHQHLVYHLHGALPVNFPVNIWVNRQTPSRALILFALAVFKMETGQDFSLKDIEDAIKLL